MHGSPPSLRARAHEPAVVYAQPGVVAVARTHLDDGVTLLAKLAMDMPRTRRWRQAPPGNPLQQVVDSVLRALVQANSNNSMVRGAGVASTNSWGTLVAHQPRCLLSRSCM